MYYKIFRHNFFRNIKNNKMSKYYLLILLVFLVFFGFLVNYFNDYRKQKPENENPTVAEPSSQTQTDTDADMTAANDDDVIVDTQKNYKIEVNISTNTLYVYEEQSDASYSLIKAYICSVSGNISANDTPYTVNDRFVWRPINSNLYCQYTTRLSSNIVIESLPYDGPNKNMLMQNDYNNLGNRSTYTNAVMMPVIGAQWVYLNCKKDTPVTFYENPGEVLELVPDKMPPIQWCIRWDPTDPDKGNIWSKTPVKTFDGIRTQTIPVGSYFNPLNGVKAYDENDNDITSCIYVDGKVDTSTPGEYYITYVVVDIFGGNVIWDCNIIVQ